MHDGDDIDETAALHRVMHEMRIEPEPQMHQRLAEYRLHRIGRDERAPGGAMREARRALPAELFGDMRPEAVGADQRYAALFRHLLATAQREVTNRFATYENMAKLTMPVKSIE